MKSSAIPTPVPPETHFLYLSQKYGEILVMKKNDRYVLFRQHNKRPILPPRCHLIRGKERDIYLSGYIIIQRGSCYGVFSLSTGRFAISPVYRQLSYEHSGIFQCFDKLGSNSGPVLFKLDQGSRKVKIP